MWHAIHWGAMGPAQLEEGKLGAESKRGDQRGNRPDLVKIVSLKDMRHHGEMSKRGVIQSDTLAGYLDCWVENWPDRKSGWKQAYAGGSCTNNDVNQSRSRESGEKCLWICFEYVAKVIFLTAWMQCMERVLDDSKTSGLCHWKRGGVIYF